MLRSGQNRILAAGALLAATVASATILAPDALLAAPFESSVVDIYLAPKAPTPADFAPAVAQQETAEVDAELECMAKVVMHEAGNQSHAGQLAVAQLIQNRMASGRFPDTVCAVVNQPGQFFRTSSYNPDRESDQWDDAVAVSREAMAGRTAKVVPGAMFFHAAYAAPTSFFRSRTRVVTLGDHVFYR